MSASDQTARTCATTGDNLEHDDSQDRQDDDEEETYNHLVRRYSAPDLPNDCSQTDTTTPPTSATDRYPATPSSYVPNRSVTYEISFTSPRLCREHISVPLPPSGIARKAQKEARGSTGSAGASGPPCLGHPIRHETRQEQTHSSVCFVDSGFRFRGWGVSLRFSHAHRCLLS